PVYGQQQITASAVVNAKDIQAVKNGQIPLNNISEGVLVTALTGGNVDEDMAQLLAIEVQGRKNASFNRSKKLNFSRNIPAHIADKRHGISESEYIKQINQVQSAVRQGSLFN